MTTSARLVFVVGVLLVLGLAPGAGADEPASKGPETFKSGTKTVPSERKSASGWENVPLPPAAKKGIKWLIINQNPDGGWGQEGRLTTNQKKVSRPVGQWRKSDVGNTSFATLAILSTGSTPSRGTFQGPLRRAVDYILDNADMEPSTSRPPSGRKPPTQIHGKIGRYADTFLAARVLLEVEGTMPDNLGNHRVARALGTILPAIERLQAKDGSWHQQQGSWAPIHSTSYASQALWIAHRRGHKVDKEVLAKTERFTIRALREQARSAQARAAAAKPKRRGKGRPPTITPGSGGPDLGSVTVGSAGVVLYSLSQAVEQLTRTPDTRKRFRKQVQQIANKVQDERILKGLGSMGGEEFISYANINLALARVGGLTHKRWDASMKSRLAKLQNRDGSWSGHHCITGRTAVTGLAVLTLTAERQVPRAVTK